MPLVPVVFDRSGNAIAAGEAAKTLREECRCWSAALVKFPEDPNYNFRGKTLHEIENHE